MRLAGIEEEPETGSRGEETDDIFGLWRVPGRDEVMDERETAHHVGLMVRQRQEAHEIVDHYAIRCEAVGQLGDPRRSAVEFDTTRLESQLPKGIDKAARRKLKEPKVNKWDFEKW